MRSPTTIEELVKRGVDLLAVTSNSPKLDAELLVSHALKKSRVYLIAHNREPVVESLVATIESLFQRRLLHEPIAYLTGKKEFWGHVFQVTPAVSHSSSRY